MSTDPFVDPKPGDVIMGGPPWQRERYEVLTLEGNLIGYRLGMATAIMWTTRRRWAEWFATDAEVLQMAPR